MAFPKLYTDEDVDPLLAGVLREKGFDAMSCHQSRMWGQTDEAQLQFAAKHPRVILTHNIRDFCLLAREWAKKEKMHSGIILSRQGHFSKLLPATIKLLGISREQSIQNQVIWLKI